MLGVFIDVRAPWGTCGHPASTTISGLRRTRTTLYVRVTPGPPSDRCIAIFESAGVHYWDVVAIPRSVISIPLPRRVVVNVGAPCVPDNSQYRCPPRR